MHVCLTAVIKSKESIEGLVLMVIWRSVLSSVIIGYVLQRQHAVYTYACCVNILDVLDSSLGVYDDPFGR